MKSLTQRWRFVALGLNGATFYAVKVWLTDDWGLAGGEAAWVTAAIGWWILGLVTSPWFRPPRDALAASVASFLILATIELGAAQANDALAIARAIGVGYAIAVITFALIAGSVEKPNVRGPVRQLALDMAQRLAVGEALFGAAALVSIFGFYPATSEQILLVALWFGFALLRPYELLIDFGLKAANGAGDRKQDIVGTVRRIDDPDIVRVSLSLSDTWIPSRLHSVRLPGGSGRYVVPLFLQTQESELLGTGICVGEPLDSVAALQLGGVYLVDDPDQLQELITKVSGGGDSELVGFVVEGSHIGAINFEIAHREQLEEGAVVFCRLGDTTVFYQILDARTSEESFVQNPRGTHIATAVQLGTHNPQGGFDKYPWLPPMNTPMFKPADAFGAEATLKIGEFVVGHVPSTKIPVRVMLPDLVEFHSAILGVTGTGKTELALDIVREALGQGVKVVCVDLTGEYVQRLEDLHPTTLGLEDGEIEDLDAKLFDVETGTYGAGAEKKALKEFLDDIHDPVQARVADFLTSEEHNLAIFELSEVTNTRASLRTTELFLTEIMMWARRNRREKRILIVLEEAHTTVPETSGAGFDYDTQWVVSRIGQIALQGRKYGVGLLLVSQRTALVSKTVLSQCNTYFVHSLVDQTSLGYLTNVLSAEHVRSVPNLRFLEFIAYGKAVGSDRPIVVRRQFDEKKYEASVAIVGS